MRSLCVIHNKLRLRRKKLWIHGNRLHIILRKSTASANFFTPRRCFFSFIYRYAEAWQAFGITARRSDYPCDFHPRYDFSYSADVGSSQPLQNCDMRLSSPSLTYISRPSRRLYSDGDIHAHNTFEKPNEVAPKTITVSTDRLVLPKGSVMKISFWG